MSNGKHGAASRPFIDPQSVPDPVVVERVLGATSVHFLDLMERTGDFTQSWVYTKGSGWLLKLAVGGKALCYVIPLQGSFRVSMAIRKAERERLLEAPEMLDYAPLVSAARKAPEGFAIVLHVDRDGAYDWCLRLVQWVIEARTRVAS